MTSFIHIKTLYGVIENNCVRFKKSSNLRVWSTLEAPGGRTVQYRKISLRYKLFKIPFLTTVISTKTLYDQIWNICQICQIFAFFESWKFWRLLEGEKCILKGWSCKSMLFKITFLTTLISIKTFYDKIWNICVRFFISLNFLILTILATPGGRKMHSGRLIMEINVDENNISNIFYFDHKAVQSNL